MALKAMQIFDNVISHDEKLRILFRENLIDKTSVSYSKMLRGNEIRARLLFLNVCLMLEGLLSLFLIGK